MKKILAFLFLAICYLSSAKAIFSFAPTTFVNFINPVRGEEAWKNKQQAPLDFPQFLYQESRDYSFPLSWALRFDALQSATISAYFNQLTATDSSQLLAAFLEITPKQAQTAGVKYPDGDYLLQPQRAFLSGYSQPDRLKLIDTYMEKFFEKFGKLPQTVIAWHIDSYSLKYLRDKYSVTSAVIAGEYYSANGNRVWGSYWGMPYYPSKYNVLIPADSPKDRVDALISKWTAGDSFNGSAHSLFPFRISKQFENSLAVYSQKDFNEFTQVNIGIENNRPLASYKNTVKNIFKTLNSHQDRFSLRFISHPEFADWHFTRYPESSSSFAFFTTDPNTKNKGKVFLYQTPRYRIALRQTAGKTQITDFRVFNPQQAESFYLSPNTQKKFYLETPSIIDTAKYKNSGKFIDFNLEEANLDKEYWDAILTSAGKTIRLEPKKIIFKNITPPSLQSGQVKVKIRQDSVLWRITPSLPFQGGGKILVILATIGLLALSVVFRKNKTILITILTTSLIVSLIMFRSGSFTPAGLSFWGPNGHDAIFHLSLINSFKQNPLSLLHPQIAGEVLQNYHIGFDWLTALVSKSSGISSLDLYFRLLPVLFAVTILVLSYKFAQKLKFSKASTVLALLGVFLSGSLGFIVSLFKTGNIFSGESVFWANQSISILLNPPFALSVLFLLIFLLVLKPKLNLKQFVALTLVGGILVQIKIYAFILLCIGLLLARKIKLLLSVGIVGFLFILPVLKLGGSAPFVFYPLWFSQTMLSAHDRLNWQFLATALQNYQAQSVWAKIILINILTFSIFIAGNLGIRILGLFYLLKTKTKSMPLSLISTIVFAGIIIPLIFTQNQNPWNTIQFMYYSLFFLSFPTALQVTKLLPKNKTLQAIAYLLVASIALPTTLGTLKDYLTVYPASRVSFDEVWGLDKLKQQPKGIVLSPLYNYSRARSIPSPKPLYGYTSTAYISAFTGQKEFLSDSVNLDITGFNYADRANKVTRFYQTKDSNWSKSFLIENNINYVYELYNQPLQFNPGKAGLVKFFDSGEVKIYKVN